MTRKYEFRDAEERVPLDAVVKTTFPTLLQVFQVHSCHFCGKLTHTGDAASIIWKDAPFPATCPTCDSRA